MHLEDGGASSVFSEGPGAIAAPPLYLVVGKSARRGYLDSSLVEQQARCVLPPANWPFNMLQNVSNI